MLNSKAVETCQSTRDFYLSVDWYWHELRTLVYVSHQSEKNSHEPAYFVYFLKPQHFGWSTFWAVSKILNTGCDVLVSNTFYTPLNEKIPPFGFKFLGRRNVLLSPIPDKLYVLPYMPTSLIYFKRADCPHLLAYVTHLYFRGTVRHDLLVYVTQLFSDKLTGYLSCPTCLRHSLVFQRNCSS
jgi:hypothetical protein